MVQVGHTNRSSHGSNHQEGRRDRDSGVKWEQVTEHAITAALLIWFFLGMAIIFVDLWAPFIPYLQDGTEVIGDPVLFMLSLTMFLSILWNISFYLKRRKELQVARKLIRWISNQRNVVPRTDKEKERVDRVLKTAIWALRNGEDEWDVIARLNEGTCGGEALPGGWARSHFHMAVARLEEAAMRDWVFDIERKERDLTEGEKALWMARAEALNDFSNQSTVL